MKFFFHSTYLGHSPDRDDFSYAFFCKKCGEVWARAILDQPHEHFVINRGCPKCGPLWNGDPAGCFTSKWNSQNEPGLWDTTVPLEVLLHDFNQLRKQTCNQPPPCPVSTSS